MLRHGKRTELQDHNSRRDKTDFTRADKPDPTPRETIARTPRRGFWNGATTPEIIKKKLSRHTVVDSGNPQQPPKSTLAEN
eukprot:4781262-Lingulodinium_polyedra.AAC.1